MKEEILKLNEDVLVKLKELDLDKVYLFEVEVGDVPAEQVQNLLCGLKDAFSELGVKGVYVPTNKSLGSFKVIELKKYLEEN